MKITLHQADTEPDKKNFEHTIIIIFLTISLNMRFGHSKEPFIGKVLWVPTTYVLVEKYENEFLITHSYLDVWSVLTLWQYFFKEARAKALTL